MPEFPAPVDFDEWMEREVIPAAVAYYNYWTDPDLVYRLGSSYLRKILTACYGKRKFEKP